MDEPQQYAKMEPRQLQIQCVQLCESGSSPGCWRQKARSTAPRDAADKKDENTFPPGRRAAMAMMASRAHALLLYSTVLSGCVIMEVAAVSGERAAAQRSSAAATLD